MKTTTLTLAFSLLSGSAYAACSPSDLIGKWDIYINRAGIYNNCKNVTISSAGILSGSCSTFDAYPAWFQLITSEAFKVSPTCDVTGQFRRYHPQQDDNYAVRLTLDRTKSTMNGAGFIWPGVDSGIGITATKK